MLLPCELRPTSIVQESYCCLQAQLAENYHLQTRVTFSNNHNSYSSTIRNHILARAVRVKGSACECRLQGNSIGSISLCLDEMRMALYDERKWKINTASPVFTIGTCMRVLLHTGDAIAALTGPRSGFGGVQSGKGHPCKLIAADHNETVAVWLYTIDTCHQFSIRTFTGSSLTDLAKLLCVSSAFMREVVKKDLYVAQGFNILQRRFVQTSQSKFDRPIQLILL